MPDLAPLFSFAPTLKGVGCLLVGISPLLFPFKFSLASCFVQINLGEKGIECVCVCLTPRFHVTAGMILEMGSKEGKQLARVVQDGFLK